MGLQPVAHVGAQALFSELKLAPPLSSFYRERKSSQSLAEMVLHSCTSQTHLAHHSGTEQRRAGRAGVVGGVLVKQAGGCAVVSAPAGHAFHARGPLLEPIDGGGDLGGGVFEGREFARAVAHAWQVGAQRGITGLGRKRRGLHALAVAASAVLGPADHEDHDGGLGVCSRVGWRAGSALISKPDVANDIARKRATQGSPFNFHRSVCALRRRLTTIRPATAMLNGASVPGSGTARGSVP